MRTSVGDAVERDDGHMSSRRRSWSATWARCRCSRSRTSSSGSGISSSRRSRSAATMRALAESFGFDGVEVPGRVLDRVEKV